MLPFRRARRAPSRLAFTSPTKWGAHINFLVITIIPVYFPREERGANPYGAHGRSRVDMLEPVACRRGGRSGGVGGCHSRPPPHAGAQDLLVAVSYSGDTEETLAAVREGAKRKCRIVAITSGGKLADWAQRHGAMVVRVPPKFPPRGAFGYLFSALPAVMEDWVYGDLGTELERAASHLSRLAQEYRVATPSRANPAKSLALRLRDRTPIVYGAPPHRPRARRRTEPVKENAGGLARAVA